MTAAAIGVLLVVGGFFAELVGYKVHTSKKTDKVCSWESRDQVSPVPTFCKPGEQPR